ncbi:MAG: hypothetical protein ACOC5T_08705 [Elusimicrobiota bacterium]
MDENDSRKEDKENEERLELENQEEETKVNETPTNENQNSNSRKSIIEEARELKEQNQKLIDELKKERTQLEKIQSEIMLSGKAGFSQDKQKTEDELYLERTKERYKGLGFNPIN